LLLPYFVFLPHRVHFFVIKIISFIVHHWVRITYGCLTHELFLCFSKQELLYFLVQLYHNLLEKICWLQSFTLWSPMLNSVMCSLRKKVFTSDLCIFYSSTAEQSQHKW
jgi:hypothetical protein